MTKSRGILAPRHRWLEADIDALRRLYPDHTAQFCAQVLGVSVALVYAKAHKLGLKKSAAFLASPASGRLDGVKGADTRFKPGHAGDYAALRKGVRFSPRTEFKPGSAPANRLEVGALRINSMGDIDIKVAPGPRQWVSLRRYVWESECGPIPPEMCVAVKNHDPHDTRLENLVLLTRAENIAHNLLRRYPKELRNTMALAGRVRNRIQQIQGDQHA